MHIHPPKPLHGWKEFLNEIFVIVVGVLIALGLEAVVEQWHWHHQIENARETLHQEIAGNLRALQVHQANAACFDANLAELQRLIGANDLKGVRDLVHLRDVGALHLGLPGLSSSAWDTVKDSGLLAHMPPPEKLALSSAYDDFQRERRYQIAFTDNAATSFYDASVADGSAGTRQDIQRKLAEARGFNSDRARKLPDLIAQVTQQTGVKPDYGKGGTAGARDLVTCVRFDQVGKKS